MQYFVYYNVFFYLLLIFRVSMINHHVFIIKMVILMCVEIVTSIIAWIKVILSICFRILKLIYFSLKNKNFYQRLPGFKWNGHWLFEHSLIIKKVGHIHILNKISVFYKFSNGFLSYYDPRLIQRLIKNSDRCLEEIHTNVFLWRVDTMGTRQMRSKLKTLRNLFHKCYRLQSKQYYIKTCRDVCVSCIDNLGIKKKTNLEF